MEEIDLSSPDDVTLFTDDERVSVNKINREFRQQSKFKGVVREFTIFNDIHCYQFVQKKHGGKTKFRVNLTYLDPQPVRDFNLADSWLITAAISAILSFLLIYAGWFSSLKFDPNLLFILVSLTTTFAIIAFLITLLRTRDTIQILSRYGRIPVLEFINRNPDSNSFHEFMESLGQHIISAQHQADSNTTDKLALELKELRRLKNEDVITETTYEQAKKRIFRNKAFKS